jgi:hypothetical protein
MAKLPVIPHVLVTEAPIDRSRSSEPLKEIIEYATYEADWDLEGALPIAPEAIELASLLVQQVDRQAMSEDVPWQSPTVSPDPDGGIDLIWGNVDQRVIILTRPGQTDTVECIIKKEGTKPQRENLPIEEAVRRALWAISGK